MYRLKYLNVACIKYINKVILSTFIVLLVISCSQDSKSTASISTLEQVKNRDYLICGINTELPGFSYIDANHQAAGLDVDICRAVAAAVLGDANKVKYITTPSETRFQILQEGKIDILSRTTSWLLSRDTLYGIDFTAIIYYDRQGFMVPKDTLIKKITDLTNTTICVLAGTSSETNMHSYLKAKNIRYNPLVFQDTSLLINAYTNGRCDAYTSDLTILTSRRTLLANPDAHIILPDVISKEPISPAVSHDDAQWRDIVTWIIYAMINAEEIGLDSANVESKKHHQFHDSIIMRFLGYEGNIGHKLGLKVDWAYNIIKQVGNYSEIYEQNLGAASGLNIPRRLNKLWNDGGLIYAPPIL
jgi:general L-amino acid transport system substrate-binding protein